MTTFKAINPATGATVAEYPAHSPADVEAKLARSARDAAGEWRRTPVAERAAIVSRLGELLEAEKERLGRLMTLEMGKPIQAAIDEAAKCAAGCRYYAEHGPRFVADARDRRRQSIAPSSRTSRSASCSRSCRGTSPSGR